MFVTTINDCRDGNTMARQATRLAHYFPGASISTLGIGDYVEMEAAGNIIDVLDAGEGEEGVILVNAAPRHKKKWPNGTPFGYFWYKKTLVVSTVDGYCLSLVKKLGLVDSIFLTDVPTVVDAVIQQGLWEKDQADAIVKTQFRSFEYSPRLAKWLMSGANIPTTIYPLSEIPDAPAVAWWVDNFGNVKTTLLPEDIGFQPGKVISTKFGDFSCFTSLKDVPLGEKALTIGSSGLGNKRFLEIVIMGKRAADTFNIQPGSEIF